jgi:hypothetical protein
MYMYVRPRLLKTANSYSSTLRNIVTIVAMRFSILTALILLALSASLQLSVARPSLWQQDSSAIAARALPDPPRGIQRAKPITEEALEGNKAGRWGFFKGVAG